MLDFLAYLELERGVSPNTLQSYRSDLLQFGAFLEKRGSRAEEAGPRDVGDFLTGLAVGDGGVAVATATIQRKAACLRSFYRHLRREGVRESDPTAGLSTPRKSQKLPARAGAGRGAAAARPAEGHRTDRPARPGAARADVRVRAARVGGDHARAGPPGPEGRRRAGARQGLEGADRAGRPRGGEGGRGVSAARAAGARGCARGAAPVRQLPGRRR